MKKAITLVMCFLVGCGSRVEQIEQIEQVEQAPDYSRGGRCIQREPDGRPLNCREILVTSSRPLDCAIDCLAPYQWEEGLPCPGSKMEDPGVQDWYCVDPVLDWRCVIKHYTYQSAMPCK